MLLMGIVVGLVAGLVLKGSLTNLAELKFRAFYLVLISFAVQLLILVSPLSANPWIIQNGAFVYVISLDLLLLGLLLNRHFGPAFWLVIAGACLNLLVISQNQGTMPVDLYKLSVVDDTSVAQLAAEFSARDHLSYRSPLTPESKFTFLGDILYIPVPMFDNGVYSVGDVLIALGLALFVPQAMRGRFSRKEAPEPTPVNTITTAQGAGGQI